MNKPMIDRRLVIQLTLWALLASTWAMWAFGWSPYGLRYALLGAVLAVATVAWLLDVQRPWRKVRAIRAIPLSNNDDIVLFVLAKQARTVPELMKLHKALHTGAPTSLPKLRASLHRLEKQELAYRNVEALDENGAWVLWWAITDKGRARLRDRYGLP